VVYVITHRAVQRDTQERKWWMRGAAFTTAAIVGAGLVGLALGAIGSSLGVGMREAITVGCAALIGAAGTQELAWGSIRLLQFNRETSRRLRTYPLFWAAYNGFVLGTAFRTRIGFVVWYVVPLAALLAGDALIGGLLYATYGASRGLAPWLLISADRRGERRFREHLLRGHRLAQRLSGTTSIVACSTAFAALAGGHL
jgi:hypothetical protein